MDIDVIFYKFDGILDNLTIENRFIVKYIFIVNIFGDIDIDAIFYKLDEILDNLTMDNDCIFFKLRSSTPT